MGWGTGYRNQFLHVLGPESLGTIIDTGLYRAGSGSMTFPLSNKNMIQFLETRASGAGLFDGCAPGPFAAQRLVARSRQMAFLGKMDRAYRFLLMDG